MSEKACGSNVGTAASEENKKRKASGSDDACNAKKEKVEATRTAASEENKKRKASGSDDACNAKKEKVEATRTVFDLPEDCWKHIMHYLNVEDLLGLASANLWLGKIYKSYASHRYIHIDESVTRNISDAHLDQLLRTFGGNLVSYESELNKDSKGDEHLWLLRSHCTNLRHLKMTFRRPRWHDLNSLKHLESLHAYLHFPDGDKWCVAFVQNLKEQHTCLRNLHLEAASYSGRGLHVLDQLESLKVGAYSGFDANCLADCCQTMKKLRHLDFGHRIQNMTKINFDILVKSCKELESLAFGVYRLDATVPYELVCQLPRLQRLQVWHDDSVRVSFLEGLINKQGFPLESLVLLGPDLQEDQVKHLCNISTLKELEVSCDTVPLEDLLKLKNLQYLHISMPSIMNEELLKLLMGLPHLKVLNLRRCRNIDNSFVNSFQDWVSKRREQRGRIKLYFENSPIHDDVDVVNVDPLVEIIKGSLRDPILIRNNLVDEIRTNEFFGKSNDKINFKYLIFKSLYVYIDSPIRRLFL